MPARKVQISSSWMYCKPSRIWNSSFQCFSFGSIEFGHIQVLTMPIQPIQLSADPVNSNAFQTVTVMSDDRFPMILIIHFRPENSLSANITIVDVIIPMIKVQRDHIHEIKLHKRVDRSIERHISHIVLVGEYQPRTNSVPALARVFVGCSVVIGLVTFAVVGARCVATVLRTDSWRFYTLVNVGTGFAVF